MDNGIGLGDLLAVMNSKDNDKDCGGWSWILILFIFFAFFGGGFGMGGKGAAFTGTEFTLNDIQRQLQDMSTGLYESTFALNNSLAQDYFGLSRDLGQGLSGVNGNISELGYKLGQCCCETNRNIDAVRYENAKNTCDIINSGHSDTQRIIDALTEDKIDSLRTDLQSAQLALSNTMQTNNLIAALRPFPQPAYITSSPYTTNNCGYSC